MRFSLLAIITLLIVGMLWGPPVQANESESNTESAVQAEEDSAEAEEADTEEDQPAEEEGAVSQPRQAPVEAAFASTAFTVEGRPFRVQASLYARNIRNSLGAFRKNPFGFQYADYELQLQFGSESLSVTIEAGEVHFQSIVMEGISYSSGSKHIWHVSFVGTGSGREWGTLDLRRDFFFLYDEERKTCVEQFRTRQFAESRHAIVPGGSFSIEREVDGNLDWDYPDQLFLKTVDTMRWQGEDQPIVEYRTRVYRWDAEKQLFVEKESTLEYEIRKGDLLVTVGRFYFHSEMGWQKIVQNNPKLNPRNLKIGARVKIPLK